LIKHLDKKEILIVMLTSCYRPIVLAASVIICCFQAPVLAQSTGSTVPEPALVDAAPVNPDEQSSYVLGPGDQIEILVFGYEEYTGVKVIPSDGTITLPVIGTIMAAGRTNDELAQNMVARLQYYLVDPNVTVSLVSARAVVVNVAGQVQRPGPLQLSGNQPNGASLGTPTLSSALTQAGGVTQNADIRQIVVRRPLPGGDYSTSVINLWDALVSDNGSQNLRLQDGDSIFVPELAPGEPVDRRLIARSSLSPSSVRVRVVGEVTRPGEVQVAPGSSLSSAIAIAGGPTEDARLSQVAFIRMNDDGQIERQTVDLRNLSDNYQVQDGDVVLVPQTDTSSALDFIGRIINPFNFILNLFR
jgi:polysaccharide biosynthesis/export protein